MSSLSSRRTARRHRLLLAAGLAVSAVPSVADAVPARPAATAAEALQMLSLNTAGQLTRNQRLNDAYATVQSAAPGRVLMADGAAGTPLQRAQNFLSIYGAVLGVQDPIAELRQKRLTRDAAGASHVHLDQYYRGLPVFGARVVVHMNDQGITGTNGVFLKDLALSTTPQMSVASLRDRALAAARKLHPDADLAVESSRLMIYRSGLLKGVEGKDFLAYEVIVRGAAGAAVRERVILNANTGAVLNRINEIHAVLNRAIYTPTMDVPPLLTEGSLLAPADPEFQGDTKGNPASRRGLDLPTNNLYIFAGGTYNLYKNLFGREGYDDGAIEAANQIQRSVYLVNQNCPNAYWDGTSTNYCPGFDADDVVSHEWSHAYTEFTHGLVYQYQSGALNESYSDIFGEMYDLVNGLEGPLGVTLTEGTTYNNRGSRWVVGEDLSEVAAAILLRDMWDPDTFPTPSPGSVITSENYYCDTGDNGGVHTNSGVSNHAFAMLVDGKEFNGRTIPAIGLIKAAHIYFRAETVYQTPTTNYPQHADAIEQSCSDLIGKPLNDVFGKVSDQVITAQDCAAVREATLAVEFRNTETTTVAQKCGYIPVLQPEASTPALCPTGKFPTATFSENWESGAIPSGWTTAHLTTGDTTPALYDWQISSALPAPHSGKAAFAIDETGGTCAAGGDISGSFWLDSPELDVPDDASYLSFTHFMQAEAGYDGGNLKYSVNGSEFAIVPQDAFTYNAHSSTFTDAPLIPGIPDPVGLGGNNTSPLAGQAAWSGADQGEATGSWGTTIVDIAKLGAAKDAKIKFRWEFGNDGCGGNVGWFVDDLSLGFCSLTAPVNTAPIASLVASIISGTAPLTVNFTMSGTDADAGDRAASYRLDFGDATPPATGDFASGASSAAVTHTYTTAGTFAAKLTVIDSKGQVSAINARTITVSSSSSGGGGSSGGGSGGGTGGGSTGGEVPVTQNTGGCALGATLLLPLLAGFGLRRRRRA